MITSEMKKEIIATYGRTPEDTGSPEVQIFINSSDQRLNRASESTQKRPSFQTWSVKNGWSETWYARLSQEDRYRKIQSYRPEVRFKKIILNSGMELSIPLFASKLSQESSIFL